MRMQSKHIVNGDGKCHYVELVNIDNGKRFTVFVDGAGKHTSTNHNNAQRQYKGICKKLERGK